MSAKEQGYLQEATDTLNKLIAERFPELIPRDPRYRYWQNDRTRYCYTTEPMGSKGKPWACWNEVLVKAGKNRLRVRRSKVSYFGKRKTARSHAYKRYEHARKERWKREPVCKNCGQVYEQHVSTSIGNPPQPFLMCPQPETGGERTGTWQA